MAAKRELVQVIDRLQPQDKFTVLVFDNDVRMWQKKLVLADAAAKKKAHCSSTSRRRIRRPPRTMPWKPPAIRRRGDLLPHRRCAVRRQSVGPGPNHRIHHVDERLAPRVDLYDRHRGRGARQPDGFVLADLAETNYGVYRRVDE